MAPPAQDWSILGEWTNLAGCRKKNFGTQMTLISLIFLMFQVKNQRLSALICVLKKKKQTSPTNC
jgi:hypothetical protein